MTILEGYEPSFLVTNITFGVALRYPRARFLWAIIILLLITMLSSRKLRLEFRVYIAVHICMAICGCGARIAWSGAHCTEPAGWSGPCSGPQDHEALIRDRDGPSGATSGVQVLGLLGYVDSTKNPMGQIGLVVASMVSTLDGIGMGKTTILSLLSSLHFYRLMYTEHGFPRWHGSDWLATFPKRHQRQCGRERNWDGDVDDYHTPCA